MISGPLHRPANPDHTPVEPVPGFQNVGGSSSGARRYPSPSTMAGIVNPFEDRRTPSPAVGGKGRRKGGDDIDRLGYEDVS
jgi:hypothetical protein